MSQETYARELHISNGPIYVTRYIRISKETYTCQKRPNDVTRDLRKSPTCVNRDLYMSHETYTYVKRDIYMSKETYTCQKRPRSHVI